MVIPVQMIRPESLDSGVLRWFCDGHGLQIVRRSPENGKPRITGWSIHEISGSVAQASRGFETSLEDKNEGHTVGMRRVDEEGEGDLGAAMVTAWILSNKRSSRR